MKQLSTHGNAKQSRVIKDDGSAGPDARYKVLVTDTKPVPNVTIQCDPRIVNDFPPL